MPAPLFAIYLAPEQWPDGPSPEKRLAMTLKNALRSHGLRCVQARDLTPSRDQGGDVGDALADAADLAADLAAILPDVSVPPDAADILARHARQALAHLRQAMEAAAPFA